MDRCRRLRGRRARDGILPARAVERASARPLIIKHRLSLPSRYQPPAFHPLVVALHGCTQNAADFAAGTGLDRFADRHDALVVYPEQSPAANARLCWNWFLPEHQSRERGEPAAIIALVDEVSRRHRIDRSRVYVVGLSAGAAMAAILAEEAPDVFAGVGMMAGVPLHVSHDAASAYLAMRGEGGPDDAELASLVRRVPPRRSYGKLRAAIWTGLRDATVAPANADRLAAQFVELLQMNAATPQREELPDGTVTRWYDTAGLLRLELRTVNALGHAWSGGTWRGSHTAPSAPSASEAMLDFFFSPRHLSGDRTPQEERTSHG